MRRLAALLLAGLLALGAQVAHAVQPDEVMRDPAKEARARALSRELRCMVCQNQSIDDSDAPLARDLRLLVRERIAAGDSDRQVLDFLVARFGEYVLLKPRFEPQTLLLWLLTPLTLLCGARWIEERQKRLFLRRIQPVLAAQLRQRGMQKYVLIGILRQRPELRRLLDAIACWSEF